MSNLKSTTKRSSAQQMSFVAALLFGAAPVAFGVFRAAMTAGSDFRMLFMALVATSFAGGVLAAAVGRRRTKRAIGKDAIVIGIVSTVLAGATAYVMGATSAFGVWAVAAAFGISLAIASVGVTYARPSTH